MSLIHLARQGFITKSALPNVTRQRGTTTGTANLMLYGAGKDHSIGTNTTFTDSSTNAFTVTRNGDTIQATNNPFTGSVYFDGNGDYLTIPNNTALNPGTGDFTFELWVYFNALTQGNIFDGNTNGISLALDASNRISFGQSNVAYLVTDTAAMTIESWFHIVVVRSGTTLSLFKNGSRVATATNSSNFTTGTINRIGWNGFSAYFNGYISNLRIVKGTAVYSPSATTITVPTSPLTAITNTQLLLLTAQQAPLRDSSANNFTVTANGNAAGNGVEPFPVNYAGSAYFDGTGDYLSIANNIALQPGTGIFTIEAWIYRNASGAAHTIYAKGGASTGFVLQVTATNVLRFIDTTTNIDSTGTISATTWTHVAVVRSGTGTNETKLYINGTQDGQGTVTTDFNQTEEVRVGTNRSAAENFAGYISNCRFIKGTAQYTANFTPPSAPLTAVTNTQLLLLTNNVGPFVDTSANGFPILRNGDTVQTGFSPFTGQPSAGAGYFDGTGDSLKTATNSSLAMGSGDFSVEAFVYQSAVASQKAIAFFDATATFGLILYPSTTLQVIGDGGATILSDTASFPTSQWVHVAFTRSGTTVRLFVNGTQKASGTNSTNFSGNGTVTVGSWPDGTTFAWNGYISNLRVIKGTALYTSNFTPATAPLPAVPNTSLLLNTDNYTIANSTPTYLPVTVNGNTTVSTAQYPTGMNRSVYFDGTGDTFSVPTNSMFEFGTGTFTVECFIYQTANSGVRGVLGTHSSYFAGGWGFYINNGSVVFQIFVNGTSNSDDAGNSTTVALNTWTHIAAVRDGSTLTVYVNGVAGTSVTSTKNGNNNAAFYVGAYEALAQFPYYFTGYISNVRVIKGSALYTANFTPPAAPLPLSVTVPAYVTNNIYGVYQLA
jgi:hypothetical protein